MDAHHGRPLTLHPRWEGIFAEQLRLSSNGHRLSAKCQARAGSAQASGVLIAKATASDDPQAAAVRARAGPASAQRKPRWLVDGACVTAPPPACAEGRPDLGPDARPLSSSTRSPDW